MGTPRAVVSSDLVQPMGRLPVFGKPVHLRRSDLKLCAQLSELQHRVKRLIAICLWPRDVVFDRMTRWRLVQIMRYLQHLR